MFEAGRLVDAEGRPVTEKDFIAEAVGQNAAKDKEMFYGENREGANGCWPEADDVAFIEFAQAVKALLDNRFVEEMAAELVAKGRLEAAEIAAIAARRGA